jgi:hypothetical protein
MGVEQAFEEIAKQIEQFLPTGASSYREFLEQMALENQSTRPPVIQSTTLERLNEYQPKASQLSETASRRAL